MKKKNLNKLGLGGGCHWCTEAVIQELNFVSQVNQGYVRSTHPNNDWSEAVIIYFENITDLEIIIQVHLATHNSLSNHSRRDEYRSAVYFFSKEQQIAVENILISLSRKRQQQYITKVLKFQEFKVSRESIQNYYATRPNAPFCKRYIEPKLCAVRKLLDSIDS